MDYNKICPNCGQINKNDSQYCAECGTSLIQNSNDFKEQNKKQPQDESEPKAVGILSLVLFYIGIASTMITSVFSHKISNIGSTISGPLTLASIVIIIIGMVKFPQNKFLKKVLVIIIVSFIISIIIIYLFLIKTTIDCVGGGLRGCDF